MKTYNAVIRLNESDLRAIIAEAAGVKPENVRFDVVEMQRDCTAVNAVITKQVTLPIPPLGRREESGKTDERAIDCEIVLDAETLKKGPCADD